MENQKQNPTPSSGEGVADEKPLELFNIMPKATSKEGYTSVVLEPKKSSEQMPTQPTLNPITKTQPEVKSNTLVSATNIKKYIFIALGGLLAAGLAFGAWKLYQNYINKPSTEEAVSQTPNEQQPNQENNQTQQEQPDQLPREWVKKYFNEEVCSNPNICGKDSDVDRDGLVNEQEFKSLTDPNNPDSDRDGIADGDEVNIFRSNPLKTNSLDNPKYPDADYVKGGYSFLTDNVYTPSQLAELKSLVKTHGFHEPTISTVGQVLVKLYEFNDPNIKIEEPKTATSTPEGFDSSIEAKQERDAQRSSTIKNIGIALLKYKSDTQKFPQTQDFKEMHSQVRPYLKVATNPQDPINKGVFVYSYSSTADDFVLTFFSETAGQVIRKKSADALKDKVSEESAILDDQRKNDMESIRSALLLYSAKNLPNESTMEFVFPSQEKYKTALVPEFLNSLPKDPKNQADYEYKVGVKFDTFTLKTFLDNPSPGTTGYLCNQEECSEY